MSDPGFNVAGEANWERYLTYCLSIDKLAAEMYQLGLEQAGIRVTIVADANSFSKAIEEPPDAVVIEWEMLDVAGDEMLKQLALDARMAGRSVFVLINFISRVNDKTGTLSCELGATEWLVKSATAPDLWRPRYLGALDHGRSPELAGSSERWCVPGFSGGVPSRSAGARTLSGQAVISLPKIGVGGLARTEFWIQKAGRGPGIGPRGLTVPNRPYFVSSGVPASLSFPRLI